MKAFLKELASDTLGLLVAGIVLALLVTYVGTLRSPSRGCCCEMQSRQTAEYARLSEIWWREA